MSPRSFTVLYEPAEGGGYYAHVPALDLTTEGRTLKEAKAMAESDPAVRRGRLRIVAFNWYTRKGALNVKAE